VKKETSNYTEPQYMDPGHTNCTKAEVAWRVGELNGIPIFRTPFINEMTLFAKSAKDLKKLKDMGATLELEEVRR